MKNTFRIHGAAWLFAVAALALFVFSSSEAEAQACTSATSTNEQHVAAGRATLITAQTCNQCVFGICGFPAGCEVVGNRFYRPVGSTENIGMSPQQTTTLYGSGSSWSTTPCVVVGMRWVSVPGSAFASTQPTDWDSTQPRSQYWEGMAPLSLPDGALVRELRCSFYPGVPLAPEPTNSRASIVDYSLATGQLLSLSEQLNLTGARNYTARAVSVTLLPAMNNQTIARSISVILNHSSVPPDGQGYFTGCTVGYTL